MKSRICTRVTLLSADYGSAKRRLQAELSSVGNDVQEFHATEVVNPSTRSAWREVPIPRRAQALSAVIAILKDTATSIPYLYLSGEQYEAELKAQILAARPNAGKAKSVLEHAFFYKLIPFLKTTADEVALVMDSSKPLDDAIRIQALADPGFAYEGGVIQVDSRDEAGVQIADLAAYLFNRLPHSRQRAHDGRLNEFDKLIIDAACDLRPKYVNLLPAAPVEENGKN